MSDFQYVGSELDVFANAKNWKSYFAKLLRKRIHGRVLEVGAGIGTTTRALWNDSVSSWVCLEPDPALAARIDDTLAGAFHPAPKVVVGTVEDVSGEQFDTILYIDVLEHIADDRGELEAAARHLAPGGCIVTLSPAFQSLYSEFDRAIGHERRYSKQTLAAAFPPSLRKEALFYADSLGALLSFANRMLLRESSPTTRQIRFWDRVILPVSRLIDPFTRSVFGRSVIAIYSRKD